MKKLEGETVGSRVRAAYEGAGLNRNQLSKKTGLDYATIMKWEKGDASPEIASLKRVAEATGRDVAELVGGAPAPAERLERDSDRSPYPAFETYLDDAHGAERPPVSEAHARELRQARFSGEVTLGMAASLHRELIARDRGRSHDLTSTMPDGARAVRPGRVKIGPPRKRGT